jgi:hypothetical protein
VDSDEVVALLELEAELPVLDAEELLVDLILAPHYELINTI